MNISIRKAVKKVKSDKYGVDDVIKELPRSKQGDLLAALRSGGHKKSAFWQGFSKEARELTTKTRNALPDSAFVFPKERKFPIHDRAHARNALARAHFASDPSRVRAAVHAKYPDIGEEKKAEVSREDLKRVLKKHEERETPAQEAAESAEEQRIEREAGVEPEHHKKQAFWAGFSKKASDVKVDINHKLDPDLKKTVKRVGDKLKKLKLGPRHLLGAAAGIAGLTGSASLGSTLGKGLGEKITKSERP